MHAFAPRPVPLEEDREGTIRIATTRVSLETVVEAFDAGATAEEIALAYPTLDLPTVYAVLSYVLDHRADVDAYVAKRRAAASAVQTRVETHRSPAGLRDRLLARGRP